METRQLLSGTPVAVGSEFQVNSYTTRSQRESSIAADANGNFVVSWSSDGQDGSGWGVYAQRYNSAGIAEGSEFRVNSLTMNDQNSPSVAMNADGDFVISWQSYEADGSYWGICAQRYNSDGVAQGSELQINTYTTGFQQQPSVAIDAAGDFVIAWTCDSQDGSYPGVFAQRYNAAGVAQGSEFQVNTYTSDTQMNPSVAMDGEGNFVISWDSAYQDGSDYGIYARRYNVDGVAQGNEFLVNVHTASYQRYPSVAMNASGTFVISWGSVDQESGWGVYARRYNSTGASQGGEFHVNTYTTNDQIDPTVAMDAAGNFVIGWRSDLQDGDKSGVYAQQYNASGVAQGSEFRANTYTTGNQRDPAVAMDAAGNFIICWTSDAQQGNQTNIYAQRYTRGTRPTDLSLSSTSIAENQAAGTSVGTFSSTDMDSSETFSYALVAGTGADDNAQFTISGSQLRTAASFDYETKPTYMIRVRVTDSDGLTFEKPLIVRVTDVNEFAVSEISDTNPSAGSIVKSSGAGLAGITAFASDADGTTNAITYSLTDDAGGLFTIHPTTGVIVSTGPVNDETTTSFMITVRAESADGSFSTADFSIALKETNESPAITGVTGATSYTENAAPRLLTIDGTAGDFEENLGGGSLTVRFKGFSEADDRLWIQSIGTGSGQISVDGNDVLYGGAALGSITSGGIGEQSLVIQFAAEAGNAGVQQLLRSITYASVSNQPDTTTRRIEFVLNDGAGAVSNTGARIVYVYGVNDKPVISGVTGSTSYTENAAPRVLTTDGIVTDAEDNFGGGSLTVRFKGFSEADDRLSIQSVGTASGQISVTGNDVFFGGVLLGTISYGGVGGQALVIQLTAEATKDGVQQLLRSVTYASVSKNPNVTQRRIEFVLTDGAGAASPTAARLVSVHAVNEKPAITGVTGSTTYIKNTVPRLLATDGIVGDADSNLGGGSLTVRFKGFSEADDRLWIQSAGTGDGQISVSGNNVFYGGGLIGSVTSGGVGGDSLMISLAVGASNAGVQQILRSLTYASVSSSPNTTTRRVEFVLADGAGGSSNIAARLVYVFN